MGIVKLSNIVKGSQETEEIEKKMNCVIVDETYLFNKEIGKRIY
jgi:hypothetical protein